jgi:hemolysin activation/secretion protein
MSALSQGTFVSYTLPIDTRGTKIGFDAAVFTNKLGMEYKTADITGNTQIYTPRISGEIYLSDDLQVSIDAGLEIKSNKKFIIGNVSSNDQLRLPYVGFNVSKMDTLLGGGQTSFSPKLIFSTAHFLGASKSGHPTSSRDGTGGFFFKYEQGLSRTQRMPFESYLTLRTQFQVASNSLPSSEQLQLGGANSIRGYPEGEYVCDFGGQLNVDWVFPMYIIPKSWILPGTNTPLRQQLQPVLFVDVGGGKILKVQGSEHKHRFLMGLGGGIKYQFNRNIFLRLEWAEAIGDRITPGQGPSSYNLSIQCEI